MNLNSVLRVEPRLSCADLSFNMCGQVGGRAAIWRQVIEISPRLIKTFRGTSHVLGASIKSMWFLPPSTQTPWQESSQDEPSYISVSRFRYFLFNQKGGEFISFSLGCL